MIDDLLNFYTQPGKYSDPGYFKNLFGDLPKELRQIREILHGFLIHEFDANFYKIVLPPAKLFELNLRSVEKILARVIELHNESLLIPRPPNKRVMVVCREFALLFVTICRHFGIPARVRVGFTKYLYTDKNIIADHTIAEIWHKDQNRWLKIDPRISSFHLSSGAFSLDFDLFDIPNTEFISAGQIWLDCQNGKLNPKMCGYGKKLEFNGLWYIRNRLLQDLAMLNSYEMLGWDLWGYMLTDPPYTDPFAPQQLSELHELATAIAINNFSLNSIKNFWENPNFKVSSTVRSFDKLGNSRLVSI